MVATVKKEGGQGTTKEKTLRYLAKAFIFFMEAAAPIFFDLFFFSPENRLATPPFEKARALLPLRGLSKKKNTKTSPPKPEKPTPSRRPPTFTKKQSHGWPPLSTIISQSQHSLIRFTLSPNLGRSSLTSPRRPN